MIIVHLIASRFFGGPERQLLGLARSLPADWRSMIVTFPEDGTCQTLLTESARQGIDAIALAADTPHLLLASSELAALLRQTAADVLCCHGYKADLVGRFASWRAGIPAIAVSRGWTGESLRVKCYEAIDRRVLRWMDRVVCVSGGQAEKVRRAGVARERIQVIANAIDPARFAVPDPSARRELQRLFPEPRRWIVGAAGRLSPEKGFGILVEAAAQAVIDLPEIGFVIFGDGPLGDDLTRRIARHRLQAHIVLAGFTGRLDRFMPSFDLLVLPSFTEGMPNVVLEAMAAQVPVVATAVGGTPELVEQGITGRLIEPGNPTDMARAIARVLGNEQHRRCMGRAGRDRVARKFTFAGQADLYQALLDELCRPPRPAGNRTQQPQHVG